MNTNNVLIAIGMVVSLAAGIVLGMTTDRHICEPVGPEVQQEWAEVSGKNNTLYLCVDK